MPDNDNAGVEDGWDWTFHSCWLLIRALLVLGTGLARLAVNYDEVSTRPDPSCYKYSRHTIETMRHVLSYKLRIPNVF